MRDLSLQRGYVVNLASEPREIGPGIWMSGLRELLAALRIAPPTWRLKDP